MTTHILAKSLATIEDKNAELRDQAEAGFNSLRIAISTGNSKAQEAIAGELHTIVATMSSLITAAHDHAKAALPIAVTDKGEAQSAEDAAAKGRKRA